MNDEKIKLSVIVPVYNAERYIRKMIESVLSQTYKNWELLLIECESKDRSYELCEEYEQEYPMIHVIQRENKGPGAARNQGMEMAQGKYLMFLDADDYLSVPTIMEQFIDLAEKAGSDITVCNYERLWDGKLLPAMEHKCFSELNPRSEEFRFKGFFSTGTLSYVWAKIYRKQFITENQLSFSEFGYAEDKLFNLQCYICGARYAFVGKRGYVYRRNLQSISYQYNPEMDQCWIGIARELSDWMEKRGTEQEEYRRLVHYILFFATFFSAKMEYTEHKDSVWAVRKILKKYGKDEFAKKSFRELIRDKKLRELSQILWVVMIRGFSLGMCGHCYLLLSIGIKQLIERRIDERLSDTGMRE